MIIIFFFLLQKVGVLEKCRQDVNDSSKSDTVIVWIILEQDCTHIAFDAAYGFKGQTDLHCKGVRTQSLVELRGSWEWVWLSQRSPWSSALCYFCENTERNERKYEENCTKTEGGKREEVTASKEAATFPSDTYSSTSWETSLCAVVNVHVICSQSICAFIYPHTYTAVFLCHFLSPDISFKITTFQEMRKREKWERKPKEQKVSIFLLNPRCFNTFRHLSIVQKGYKSITMQECIFILFLCNIVECPFKSRFKETNEHFIYSLSCHSKPLWLTFCSGSQKNFSENVLVFKTIWLPI